MERDGEKKGRTELRERDGVTMELVEDVDELEGRRGGSGGRRSTCQRFGAGCWRFEAGRRRQRTNGLASGTSATAGRGRASYGKEK